MFNSLHFRLAATMIAGLLAVTLLVCGFTYTRLADMADAAAVQRVEEGKAPVRGAAQADILRDRVDRTMLQALGLGVACVVLVGGLLGLLIRKNLLTPLETLADFATDVATGKLDARAEGTFVGRLAVLKRGIEVMVESMREEMANTRKKAREAERHAEQAGKHLWVAQRAHKKDEARRQGMLAAGETLENVADTIKRATADLAVDAREVNQGAEEQQRHVGPSPSARS